MPILSKRNGKTSFILNGSTTKRSGITPTSIFKIQRESKKTSVGLGNLYAGNCNWKQGG